MTRRWSWISSLPLIALLGCTSEPAEPPAPVNRAVHPDTAACDPMPYLAAAGITDLNKNPVFSISPNTQYYIRVCGKVSSWCMSLQSGATLTDPSGTTSICRDNQFPVPYMTGDTGTVYVGVTSNTSGHIDGVVTPWDSCLGAQPQFNMNFIVPGSGGCVPSPPPPSYTCGYAMSGLGCNNGRNHLVINAPDMASAITTCRSTQLSGYPDFCYVTDSASGVSTDASECAAGGGSWRPGNNCCNFNGTLSCPASASSSIAR